MKDTQEFDELKFWLLVEKRAPDDCWEWRGGRGSKGYGSFSAYDPNKQGKRTLGAHRYSLQLKVGRWLGPKEITDHTCMNRNCVNPSHLRVVDPTTSNLENCNTLPALNKRKTHCMHGHEFTPENTHTYPNKPGRQCMTCKNRLNRESKARMRAKRKADRILRGDK